MIVLVMVLVIVYPFLPGDYDRLAMPLSTMAQAFGGVALLLVPIGVAWLIYQWRSRKRGYGFALASVIAFGLVMAVVTAVGVGTSGLALGLITLALWMTLMARLIPRVRVMKGAESVEINAAPLYMTIIPLSLLGFQIAAAAEMIGDIEVYHEEYRRYPLHQAADALNYYALDHSRGKVVITIAE